MQEDTVCRRDSLSGPYEGTLLAAVALDADNHVFDVAYDVVGGRPMRTGCGF